LEPGTKETGTAEAVPAKARPLKKAHEGNWTKKYRLVADVHLSIFGVPNPAAFFSAASPV